jgi:hypothetical protein
MPIDGLRAKFLGDAVVKKKSAKYGEPVFIKDLPKEGQDTIGRLLASLNDAILNGALSWGFEVIKQLAILNGAGLAAIVAIAQAYGSNNPKVHVLAVQGTHFFVWGLMIALATMVTVYLTGLFFVRDYMQKSVEAIIGVRPVTDLRPSMKTKTIIGMNWILAVTSGVLFVLGASRIASIT